MKTSSEGLVFWGMFQKLPQHLLCGAQKKRKQKEKNNQKK